MIFCHQLSSSLSLRLVEVLLDCSSSSQLKSLKASWIAACS